MNDAKYIGMDVHQATISLAVRDSGGNLVMESTLETKAETILQFIRGLRGSLHLTFEEGTCAAWLHDLLKPHVSEVLVCDSRKNALLRVGNKNDREDAQIQQLLPELLEPCRTVVKVAVLTGLRIGEILALKWKRIDLLHGTLEVAETFSDGFFGSPKTRSSERVIPMCKELTKIFVKSRSESILTGP